MIRSSWMLGTVFLFACGVQSAPVASQSGSFAGESVVSSELTRTASSPTVPGSAQLAEVCTPGSTRLCCPFPQGCTCPGEQFCEADGQWDECYGPSPAPGPCL
jgi:hypothetical protein